MEYSFLVLRLEDYCFQFGLLSSTCFFLIHGTFSCLQETHLLNITLIGYTVSIVFHEC